MKILTTKALDNHGHSYEVHLRESKGEWVLHITTTPGQWYMSTLASFRGDRLSIDFGQKWDCINASAILTEARALVQPQVIRCVDDLFA